MFWTCGGRAVQDRLVLASVQVPPAPLRLMIVGFRLRSHTPYSPMPHVLMRQAHVDLCQLQVHPFHLPWGSDPQNSSIQFPILHAGNCRTNPLRTRNSLERKRIEGSPQESLKTREL